MRRSLAALPLILAALAAGCTGADSGGGNFQGEEEKVADVVEQLQQAGERGDAQGICTEVLARSLSDQIRAAGSSCEQEMEKAIDDADDFDLEVEDVTIDGTTATARVRGSAGDGEQVRTFEFAREGADWRATNLGG